MSELQIPDNASPPHSRRQWFHVWCLPLLWLAVNLSFLAYIRPQPGAYIFWSGLTPVMGLIGLFQDLLRLRKWVCLLYLAPPTIFFLIAVPVELLSGPAGRYEPLGRGLVYMAFLGLSLLIGLFVVPVLSCMVGLFLHFKHKVHDGRRSERGRRRDHEGAS
jgi:hypothetical protein